MMPSSRVLDAFGGQLPYDARMRKDFANSSARKQPARRGTARKTRKKQPPSRWFHAPSFSGGMILGALLVLGGAYLPELLPYALSSDAEAAIATTADKNPTTDPDSGVTFEFDDMLRHAEVDADGSLYVDPGVAAEAKANPDEYLLQAASFRSADDADALRARLLLLSLPASTDIVALASGRWYRVTVGPFASRTEAQRAVTELRERDLAPMWIKRKVDHT